MTKQEKANFIRKKLAKLYPNPTPPLNFSNPFTLLIAVLLSAQCTDERVNIVTKDLFKQAKTPKKMLSLGEKKVLEIIKSCGLAPKKSKAIIQTSKILIEQHQSKVPDNFTDLEKSDNTNFTFAVDANNLLGLVEWDLKKFSDLFSDFREKFKMKNKSLIKHSKSSPMEPRLCMQMRKYL